MSHIPADIFALMHQNTDNIRNICIMAHVDHGKTTITDFLLSANGILSSKMAGKVRMLDSRADEQERQITMKSSSIALAYKQQPRPLWQLSEDLTEDPTPMPANKRDSLFLINVIDSPGHVDFSSEVASAARASDGTFIIVDVVEGFSVQTHAVLQQAWLEGVKPCLVLNKFDRLATELRLTPMEAYEHCVRIVEQVNAVVATFVTADAMVVGHTATAEKRAGAEAKAEEKAVLLDDEEDEDEEDTGKSSKKEKKEKKDKKDKKEGKEHKKDSKSKDKDHKKDKKADKDKKSDDKKEKKEKKASEPEPADPALTSAAQVDILDEHKWVFDPAQGNVAFVSAFDAWGFRVQQFAGRHAADFGVTEAEMCSLLWGEHYVDHKRSDASRTATRTKRSKADPTQAPLFVELVLQPIWDLYWLCLGPDAVSNPSLEDQGVVLADDDAGRVRQVRDFLSSLRITLTDSEMSLGTRSWRIRLQSIFSRWCGVSDALLGMAVTALPSPVQAQARRMEKLIPQLHTLHTQRLAALPEAARADAEARRGDVYAGLTAVEALAQGVSTCDRACPETLVFVVKVIDFNTLAPVQQATANMRHQRQQYQRARAAGPGAAAAGPRRPRVLPPGAVVPGGGRPAPAASAAPAAPATTEDNFAREINELNQAPAPEVVPAPAPEASEEASAAEKPRPRFLAVARVFAGTLGSGAALPATLTVCGPKYDPADQSEEHRLANTVTVDTASLGCWLLLGRDVEQIDAAPAGNVIGLTGLDHVIYKFFSLSSVPRAPAFRPLTFQAQPIMRVIVEPVHVPDAPALLRALQLLDQIDPNVVVGVTDRGESFIAASGELHLDRCVRDLQETLCPGVEVRVHPPSAGFRETIVSDFSLASNNPTQMEHLQRVYARILNAHQKTVSGADDVSQLSLLGRVAHDTTVTPLKHGSWMRNRVARVQVPSRAARFRLRAIPLPLTVSQHLDQHRALLKGLRSRVSERRAGLRMYIEALLDASVPDDAVRAQAAALGQATLSPAEQSFFDTLRQLFRDATVQDDEETASDAPASPAASLRECLQRCPSTRELFQSGAVVDHILAFGSKHCGPNILVNRCPQSAVFSSLLAILAGSRAFDSATQELLALADDRAAMSASITAQLHTAGVYMRHIEPGLSQGFQLATATGPMCGEPLMGVCFLLDRVEFDEDRSDAGLGLGTVGAGLLASCGPISAQLRTAMHHASHAVLEAHPRRLMEAFFRAELQCVGEVLGRLVGVVNQRRGRVVSHDDMVEGTAFFNVKALLPVQASFGFVSAVRASTSGITNPVLYLSHWDVLPVDPYFVPKTELELEECGTQDLSHNLAKELVSDVRRRKGLLVDDVVVAAPEKQRTISRKK